MVDVVDAVDEVSRSCARSHWLGGADWRRQRDVGPGVHAQGFHHGSGFSGKGNHGFDAKEGKFCDLLKAGIVDPAKVAVTALQNAASAAGLNLSTDVVITEVQKNEDPVAGATT